MRLWLDQNGLPKYFDFLDFGNLIDGNAVFVPVTSPWWAFLHDVYRVNLQAPADKRLLIFRNRKSAFRFYEELEKLAKGQLTPVLVTHPENKQRLKNGPLGVSWIERVA